MKASGKSFRVSVPEVGAEFECRGGEYLLAAMRRAGLFKRGGCWGGGCGVCKVRIAEGSVSRAPMSREHVTRDEEEQGFVLACRVKPLSDLVLDNLNY